MQKHVKCEKKKYCYEKMKEISSIGCHFFSVLGISSSHSTASFPEQPQISPYHKDKTSPDLNEARDDGVWECIAPAGPYSN